MGNSQTKYTISTENGKFKVLEEERSSSAYQIHENRSKSHSKASIYPDFLVNLGEVLETKAKEENMAGIGEKVFQKYITPECSKLGTMLFAFFILKEDINREDKELPVLPKEAFIRQAFAILNLLTDSQQLEFYIKVFASNRDEMTCIEFNEFVLAAYTIAQFAHHSSCLPDGLLSAVGKAVMHSKEKTSCTYVFNWICQHCPRLAMWMHRHINHILTVGYSTIPRNVPTEEDDDVTPVLDGLRSLSLANIHPALIWLLSCSLPNLYTKNLASSSVSEDSISSFKDPHKFIKHLILAGKPSHWLQLYNSDEHGLSVNRFKHHVFDYHGPTLLFVIVDVDDTMFCLASDEEWKDSKHFYGGVDSMCFQLYPEYRIIEKGAKMVYFNISSRGFPTGLQVGMDNTNRALCIDLDFNLVHYRKIPYKLKSLEVWGCGATQAKDHQQEYKKLVAKDVEKRRKVPISSQWKDNPDRYLLEMAGRPNYASYESDRQNHSST